MIQFNKMALGSLFLFNSLLYGYEPSVYGAGDIESASPYGLTKTEQAVLNNKKTIQTIYNKMSEQQRKVDGFKSVIDGQTKEIVFLKEQLKNGQNQLTKQERLIQQLQGDASKSYKLLLELGKIIDEIKNTSVRRDELDNTLNMINQIKKTTVSKDDLHDALVVNTINNSREEQQQPRNSSSANSSLDNGYSSNNTATRVSNGDYSESYREGVKLFYQHSYEEAKEYFRETLNANHKSASSNFYLGEIAYNTQQYEDAVAYYKQSTTLDDRADYMDILYLHTAISLDNIGDREQAKGFYNYIISTYPNKETASIAQQRLLN